MNSFADIKTALDLKRRAHNHMTINNNSLPVYSRAVTRVTVDKQNTMATILFNGDNLT